MWEALCAWEMRSCRCGKRFCTREMQVCKCGKPLARRKYRFAIVGSPLRRGNAVLQIAKAYFLTAKWHFLAAIGFPSLQLCISSLQFRISRLQQFISPLQFRISRLQLCISFTQRASPGCKGAFPPRNVLPTTARVHFLTAIPYFPAAIVHFPHAKGFPRLQKRISSTQCPSHNCKSAFPHCNSVFPGCNCVFPSRKGLPPATKAHFQLVPSPFTRHTERSVSIRGHSAARGRVIHSIVSAKLLRQTSRDTQTEACQSSKPNFHLQRGTVGSPCSPLPSTRHTER